MNCDGGTKDINKGIYGKWEEGYSGGTWARRC